MRFLLGKIDWVEEESRHLFQDIGQFGGYIGDFGEYIGDFGQYIGDFSHYIGHFTILSVTPPTYRQLLARYRFFDHNR